VENNNHKISLTGAVAVIAACMIGTGVFTSLGFQVYDAASQSGMKSNFAILILWTTGGLVALCGALVYSELAVRYPGSGGEYNYLSRIYHPILGFLSGWVSATIGFAAPIALSSMAFGKYFAKIIPAVHPSIAAVIVVALASLVNFMGLSMSEKVQKGTTYLNLFLIILLIVFGIFAAGNVSHFKIHISTVDFSDIFSSSFAISLVYVSYAFSGWNAVTYIAGDVKNPNKNVPRSLLISVLLVATLYVLLNFVFLLRVPHESLAGQIEVGAIAANAIFGEIGEKIVAGLICLGLLASVLGMTIAGPRLTEKMGQDINGLKFLANRNKYNAPIVAITIQTSIALILALTDSFDAVLRYVGITLALFTLMTVCGLFVARSSNKLENQKIIPVIAAIVFIILEIWMIYHNLKKHTNESLLGLGTIVVGWVVYYIATFKRKAKNQP
jgi:APA family basic amino acid/polyamine antiporter